MKLLKNEMYIIANYVGLLQLFCAFRYKKLSILS